MAYSNNQRAVKVAVPAMVAGVSTTLTVTWPRPFLDAAYEIEATAFDPASLIGSVSITAQTAAGCTLSVKNVGLTSLLAGTAYIELTATHN